ncbi:hypothetical protein [Zooshikella ganghwensis]|uniref:Alpha/beta hydrolase n=1 Tax=Zooshikella ganghwensis TaxID=202772 RepID=A0A4P9VLV8_9GAMM|nr:hypothetical protein [Zooshikella ganghwensis]RDH43836.1 hypothetical protein B9G39_10480 [Zooshikella ganghwensis]
MNISTTKLLTTFFPVSLLSISISSSLIAGESTYDPTTQGVYSVVTKEYKIVDAEANPNDPNNPFKALKFKEEKLLPEGLKVSPYSEVEGVTYFPEGQSNLPVVLLLHGRHPVCSETMQWPCPEGETVIPSYKGYEYLGKHLASRGYFVVSISSNGINAYDNYEVMDDRGKMARSLLINHHLSLLYSANNYGASSQLGNSEKGRELASAIQGKLDFQRIGLMGHSRGGEGVLQYAEFNAVDNQLFDVDAVMLIGSVNFNEMSLTKASLGSILPYCDGDVSNLGSARIFDKTVESEKTYPHYQWTFMGANHNYFNTTWSPGTYDIQTADDWSLTYSNSILVKIVNNYLEKNPEALKFFEKNQNAGRKLIFESAALDNDLEIADPHCGGITVQKSENTKPFHYLGGIMSMYSKLYDEGREKNGLRRLDSLMAKVPNGRFSEEKTRNEAKKYITAFFDKSLMNLAENEQQDVNTILTLKDDSSNNTVLQSASQLTNEDIKVSYYQPEGYEFELDPSKDTHFNHEGIEFNFFKKTQTNDVFLDISEGFKVGFNMLPHVKRIQEDKIFPVETISKILLKINKKDGYYERNLNNIDLSNFNLLSIRMLNHPTSHSENPFQVQLTDYDNNSKTILIDEKELRMLPGNVTDSSQKLPKFLHHDVIINLNDFKGIDFTQVKSLKLIFDGGEANTYSISRIAFTK